MRNTDSLLDDLLGKAPPKAITLDINKRHPFEGHPYKVLDNEDMEALVESIRTQGVLTPLVVRPMEEDAYEIISGHRRLHACKKAGIGTVPALIYSLDRNAAAIALVDSNLHREHILPSEKAYAYKLKMDALKHQGQTCGQVGHKSRDDISDTDSGRQVQRYIRLTNLIPEILQYVDDGRISFTPAVELSYLNEVEQQDLLEKIEENDCTPSLSQACRFKKISQAEGLTPEVIAEIMSEDKANQKERIKIPTEKLRKYFPKNYTVEQIENEIIKLCEKNYRMKQRDAR